MRLFPSVGLSAPPALFPGLYSLEVGIYVSMTVRQVSRSFFPNVFDIRAYFLFLGLNLPVVFCLKKKKTVGLLWLSELSAGLQAKGSPV